MIIKAQEKNLIFNFNIDINLPSFIISDRLKIRQIIINLVTNAIKYTDQGYILCDFSYEKYGDIEMLKILVKDTGKGIEKKDLDSIFEAFVQTKSGQNSQIGTGLGLSICRNYINLLGGDIKVKSLINQGSTFTVLIPISSNDDHGISLNNIRDNNYRLSESKQEIHNNNDLKINKTWLNKITQAVCSLNHTEVKKLLEEIKEKDHKIYKTLQISLNNYNYELILNILADLNIEDL